MSYTADYPIHEGYTSTVFAQVEYDIESASGDGWDEPREEAHAIVYSATLYRITKRAKFGRDANWNLIHQGYTETRTELGDAPEWVLDIIRADDDWLSDMAMDDGPDADRARDERIDMELMERSR